MRFSGFAGPALFLPDRGPALSVPVLGAARFPAAFRAPADVPRPFADAFRAALFLVAFSDIYMIAPLLCVNAIMPILRAHQPF